MSQLVEATATSKVQPWTLPLLLVFTLWTVVLFNPDVWLAVHGATFIPQIPPLLYLLLALLIALQAPGQVWYPPLLVFVASAAVMIPFAENTGFPRALVLKVFLLYYILAIGTLTFVNSVGKTTLLLHLFLLQFLWWSFHASFEGRVAWHADLGNEDAFGPIMAIGMGYCYYFGMAARRRSLRLVAFLLSILCAIGVVASFARGAMLSAVLVLLYVWFRSPQKARTLAALAVCVVAFLVAAHMLFPEGQFWEEMSTLSSQGIEKEMSQGRGPFWKMAWVAFLEHPFFGVGAGNFGLFAMENFSKVPEMTLHYSPNHLWGWQIHSLYLQLLSEFGLIGTIAFAAMVIDFWRRNAQLRTEQFLSAWSRATQYRFNLSMLSLGLEAAMVGFLANGFFYNQLYIHWFYSLIVVNAVLHSNARRILQPEISDASNKIVRPQ